MSFDISGKLHKKFDTEQKSEKFKAREFVLEIQDGNYPQMIKFQLTQERCDVLDPYNEGDQLKVHFDLRGREWNEKFFTNLNAWRIEAATAGASPQRADEPPHFGSGDPFPTANDDPGTSADAGSTDTDDLPF